MIAQKLYLLGPFRSKLHHILIKCQLKHQYGQLSLGPFLICQERNLCQKPLFHSTSKYPLSLCPNYLCQYTPVRSYSSQDEEPHSSKPETHFLMNSPLIVWPSLLHTLKNWIFVLFIIKPFFENEFSLSSFTNVSRKAFIKVSEILSKGDFSTLSQFLDNRALEEVKKNYTLLNVKERLRLAVTLDDVFFSFPYKVGIIITHSDKDGQTAQRFFVEIMMCFHIFHGLKDHIDHLGKSDNPKGLYDNDDRISVANYRFIKEVTKGTEDQWKINILNHFKPSQVISL